jgi:hypothetical protein
MTEVNDSGSRSKGGALLSFVLGVLATLSLLWFTRYSWEMVVALGLMWTAAVAGWVRRVRIETKKVEKTR